LSMFPKLEIYEGGIESGFKHVAAAEYKPRCPTVLFLSLSFFIPYCFRCRLLHVKGKAQISVRQVKLDAKSLNSGDVFILDCGLRVLAD